jgi:hypothetical protein
MAEEIKDKAADALEAVEDKVEKGKDLLADQLEKTAKKLGE